MTESRGGSPIISWLDELENRTGLDGHLKGLRFGGEVDEQAMVVVGEGSLSVLSSMYQNRAPPTVLRFTVAPPVEPAGKAGPHAVVVLDVYGRAGFQVNRDHFLVIPDPQERDYSFSVRGPGSYDGPDSLVVNDWEFVENYV